MDKMSGVRKTGGAGGPTAIYGATKGREQADASAKTGRTDSAGITDGARELGRALQAVEAVDDVRAERVAALRAQIANGTYNPDPREVAKKLIERGF
jgi:negative regulator of flagellin synthesis FlgM